MSAVETFRVQNVGQSVLSGLILMTAWPVLPLIAAHRNESHAATLDMDAGCAQNRVALSSLANDAGVRQHRQQMESQITSKMAQWHMLGCFIVSAGPAGLTTAIYLARYRRQVLLVDADQPCRADPDHPQLSGFSLGVSGAELLTRLRKQAERYNVQLTELIRFLLPRAITTFPQRSMPSS